MWYARRQVNQIRIIIRGELRVLRLGGSRRQAGLFGITFPGGPASYPCFGTRRLDRGLFYAISGSIRVVDATSLAPLV